MLSGKKVATSLCIAFEDLSSRKRSGMELGRIGKEFPQYPWVLEAPCRSQRGFRRWMSVSHGSLSPRQIYPRCIGYIRLVRLGYLKDDSQSPYLYDYCLLGSSSGSQAE
ncbi:hypothetical protein HZH68_014691 [Vespula germanica]|uniref:Uncharacterized protein n=1 Tax=Vespula germanica TaxID=30212 RepID=A0A834J8S7_VESGE|nr:hypothetical protein HZH68_014691 [Vespula germanica]